MDLNKNNIIIFLGSPGSGKGTLSKLLVNKFRWSQFSTGDLLREHITNKTDLGKKIDFIIKSGKLISDTIIIEIVKNWLLKELKNKSVVILDGFPRTENQALALNNMLNSFCLNEPKLNLDLIIIKLEVDDKVVISRLLNRVICENVQCKAIYSLNKESELFPVKEGICSLCSARLIKRSDDELNSIVDRLKIYHQYEHKIIDVFKNSDVEIINLNVDKSIKIRYEDLLTKLDLKDKCKHL